jgi:hypothetical protein
MAYRRRSTSRNSSPRKRVYGKRTTAAKGYRTRKSVRPAKRSGVRRRNTGGSRRGVLQTLRIELAPGLSIGGSGPGITRPNPTRRTKHF